jgi:hypothetical protein
MAAVRSFVEPQIDPVIAANYAAARSGDETRILLDGIAYALGHEAVRLVDDVGDADGASAVALLLEGVLDTLDEFGGPLA